MVLPVAEVGDEILANLAGGIFAGVGVEALPVGWLARCGKFERFADPAEDVAPSHAAGVAFVDRAAQRSQLCCMLLLPAVVFLPLQGSADRHEQLRSRLRNARSLSLSSQNGRVPESD